MRELLNKVECLENVPSYGLADRLKLQAEEGYTDDIFQEKEGAEESYSLNISEDDWEPKSKKTVIIIEWFEYLGYGWLEFN